MNTLETYQIMAPSNKEDTCAKFIIDDTTSPFLFDNIMRAGNKYAFSCWLKSEAEGSITIANNQFACSSTGWTRVFVKFTASSEDLSIVFGTVGTYYIYRAQLEIGTIATDWSPAPEDLDNSNSIDEVNDRLQSIYETYSDLSIKTNVIESSVVETNKVLDEVNGRVLSSEEDISNLKLTSSNLLLNFQNISDNGVSKVITETGFTFDDSGLTVDSTNTATKTTISSDGMTVYKTDVSVAEGEELPIMLTANSEGVDATNLHAKTYLIIQFVLPIT
jgi:hypothetical protein